MRAKNRASTGVSPRRAMGWTPPTLDGIGVPDWEVSTTSPKGKGVHHEGYAHWS